MIKSKLVHFHFRNNIFLQCKIVKHNPIYNFFPQNHIQKNPQIQTPSQQQLKQTPNNQLLHFHRTCIFEFGFRFTTDILSHRGSPTTVPLLDIVDFVEKEFDCDFEQEDLTPLED